MLETQSSDSIQPTFADQKRKTVESAEFTADGRYKRKVRSFVLRTGRLSDYQKNAMNQNWATFGLDYQPQPFDFQAIYGNDNPVILEIGFGMGSLSRCHRNSARQHWQSQPRRVTTVLPRSVAQSQTSQTPHCATTFY